MKGVEKMKNQIVMIDIDKLESHPDNPRKLIGDVSELSASIKKSGVMQNLTVVEHEGKYRVVIGHRRLAASKMAGLTELPCVISDMSYKEQIATMLSENMQRIDLKLSEQVSGVQQLLDLGEDISSISESTGLSKTSIRKRAKISSLPFQEFKKAEERGATLDEYIKIMEISNEKTRFELLELAGTRDFNWRYGNAIALQNAKINLPRIRKKLSELKAVEVSADRRFSSEYTELQHYSACKWQENDEVIADYDESQKYYWCVANDWIYILKIDKKAKKSSVKKSKKEIEADRRRKELKELTQKAFEFRKSYVLSFKTCKEYEGVIDKWFMHGVAHEICGYYSHDNGMLKSIIGQNDTGYYPNENKILQWINNPGAKIVLTYYFFGDSSVEGFHRDMYGAELPVYNENPRLKLIYEFLSEIGYRISTEEEQLMNGTHELFLAE